MADKIEVVMTKSGSWPIVVVVVVVGSNDLEANGDLSKRGP